MNNFPRINATDRPPLYSQHFIFHWGVFLKIYKVMKLHAHAIKGVNEDNASVHNTKQKYLKIRQLSPLDRGSKDIELKKYVLVS